MSGLRRSLWGSSFHLLIASVSARVVTVLDLTYGFGTINDGHVKTITNNLDTGRTQAFSYDELNRLATGQTQGSSGPNCWGQSFGYDRYANLPTVTILPSKAQCTVPTLNLDISQSTNRITDTGFQYDNAGNLTADGFATYTWNAEGRLALVSPATVGYLYDGDNVRVGKSNGKLYWFGLAESDLSGNITSEYIFFNGQRIARRDVATGNVYYYLADRLGSARVVTNATGGVVEESDFLPYGTERATTATTSA